MKNIKSSIYFYTPEEGGRITSFKPDKKYQNSIWFNTHDKNDNGWSVGLFFEANVEKIEPGSTYQINVEFLYEDAYKHFNDGDELLICEGNQIIGKGIIQK